MSQTQTPTPVAKARRGAHLTPAALIVAVLFVTMIGLSVWYLTRQEPLVIQGEVQSRTFDMAARVDGRIGQIVVARSQDVGQGAPLIHIDNPELLAKQRQSEADLGVARGRTGARQGGVPAPRRSPCARRRSTAPRPSLRWRRRRSTARGQLVATHDSPQSQFDKDSAALTLAERTLDQARFAYKEAVAGFTREDLAIALAKVDSAQADVETLQALVDQMVVVAPADSQVFRIPGGGRRVRAARRAADLAGRPADMWVQFDLREDLLRDLKVGSRIDVRVPALGDRSRRAGGAGDRLQGRIHRLARHAGERRFRPAHLRDPRLPDRSRCRDCGRA